MRPLLCTMSLYEQETIKEKIIPFKDKFIKIPRIPSDFITIIPKSLSLERADMAFENSLYHCCTFHSDHRQSLLTVYFSLSLN